jgi:hypothetical protein
MKKPIYQNGLGWALLAGGLTVAAPARAQQARITLSGFVQDARSGEKLLGAAVYVANGQTGATTNAAGFYSLTLLAQDSIRLTASYLGYQRASHTLAGRQTVACSFALAADNELANVQVTSQRDAPLERRVEMSTLQIPVSQLHQLPALLGEPDVLRAFQLMPGVQSGREGSGSLYVRGGSPDQNLTLLDDVPIYYVSHIGGFLSVFDANAISDVRLIKGGFPARYGGRLSSVLDVRLKEGNKERLRGNAGIGVLATHLSLEGPLKNGKTTFLVSARRGNLDLFSRVASQISSGGNSVVGYSFYDASLKVSHQLTARDQVFAAVYLGGDRLFLTQKPQTIPNPKGDLWYQGESAMAMPWPRCAGTGSSRRSCLATSRWLPRSFATPTASRTTSRTIRRRNVARTAKPSSSPACRMCSSRPTSTTTLAPRTNFGLAARPSTTASRPA